MALLQTSNQMVIFLCFLLAAPLMAADPAENLTETDEAEFRQGGIAQQLMASSYPAGLYSGTGNAYQQYAATNGGTGYVNMLRNLYRPPSLGLTDKVKHWVKSFMNRRQYVKPYYAAPGLQYSADEFGGSGKPVMMSGGGYKAISIPLRQLQKYYKPYYGGDGAAQYLQQSQQPGSAASSSILSYNSPSGSSNGAGLYASETANGGHFSNGGAGLFGTGGSNSGLFGTGSSSGGYFGAGGSSGGLFGSGSDGSSALFAAANGGSSASNLFSGNQGGIYSSGGSSGSNIFSSANEAAAASALFGAGGLYGSSGSSSGSLYHPGNSGSSSGGSSVYSLDGSSSSGLFGSDGGSSSYYGGNSGSSNSGGNYGSRAAAASSLLTSLSGSSGASQYGDLYASGASPQASVYNPSSGDHQGRGYNTNKKQQQSSYGAGNSALYVPSSDSMRNPESYQIKSSQDSQANSFNVDSSRNSPAEASYSVSFQPAQGKSYSASYENSGFQPVAFGAEDGFKGKSS